MSAIQQVLLSFGYTSGGGGGGGGSGTITLNNMAPYAMAISYTDRIASSLASLKISSSSIILNSTAYGDDAEASGPSSYTWLSGGSFNLYSAKLSVTGSALEVGSSGINTWLPLTTDLKWTLISNSSANQRSVYKTVTGTLSIALSTNVSEVLAIANVSITANARTNSGEIP